MIDNSNLQDNNSQNNTNDQNDHTKEFNPTDIQNGKLMSCISYISILSLVPYFTEHKNKFIRFNAKQGVNLFLYETILYLIDSVISPFLPGLGFLAYLGELSLGVLSLIGIINVLNNSARTLPLMDKIKIVR